MEMPQFLGLIGAFGKMPSQGDFFRIDTPPGFVRAWDNWLAASLPAARQSLGARWEKCYYAAPIWRFSIQPGIVTPQALIGVLMPSVDRVGRAFPLTLVAPVAAESVAPGAQLAQAAFFAELEEVALDALEDHATRVTLTAALRDLPERCREAAPGMPGTPAAVLTRGVASQCLWSFQLENGLVQLRTPALPEPTMLARMFDPASAYWTAEAAE